MKLGGLMLITQWSYNSFGGSYLSNRSTELSFEVINPVFQLCLKINNCSKVNLKVYVTKLKLLATNGLDVLLFIYLNT